MDTTEEPLSQGLQQAGWAPYDPIPSAFGPVSHTGAGYFPDQLTEI